jgi:tRNA pseudouridine38-40 synthase
LRTIKLTIAYDGTRFVGWQRQSRGESIQGLLEDVLARIEGTRVTIHGAGRTDAGVHALGQVASVQLAAAHDVATLTRALNAQLPADIRVVAVDHQQDDFHARFSARAKSYRYQLRHSAIADPFDRAFTWHVPERLDVDAMRRAAATLVGTHDFAAFQSAGSDVVDTVRTITRSELVARGDLLVYEVTGTGFLRHMVRAIMGTLIETGRGRRSHDSMSALLAGGARAEAGQTAPPHGLFLVRVDYD